MYFPRDNGYPHLHARINQTGDYNDIVGCLSYLGVTFGGGGRNINLVRDGSAVYTNPGALQRIPQEQRTEADEVLRLGLP